MQILNRDHVDATTGADEATTRIGRITGSDGETITAEHWADELPSFPVLMVHGPRGASKYRFRASRAELVQFAHDILAWDACPDDAPAS